MLHKIPRILSGLLGVFLALPFALRWLLAPEATSREHGISLSGPAAFSHMRGDTGGAFFAVGALALLGLFRREPGYLEAVALIMVAVAAARLLGLPFDGYRSTDRCRDRRRAGHRRGHVRDGAPAPRGRPGGHVSGESYEFLQRRGLGCFAPGVESPT